MNHYETVFILTPVLSEPQMKEAVEKFKAVLTKYGAEIANEENWGLRKLAYPIQKKTTGFYTLLEFDAERVLRFLTFHLDKFAHEYAVKRRGLKKSAKEVKAEETPAEESNNA